MKENKLLEKIQISLYVISRAEKAVQVTHIQEQFKGRDEFDLTIVEAHKHSIGAIGLWESIKRVIRLALERDEDVIIICEDNHVFTSNYSSETLFRHIMGAAEQGGCLLFGGVKEFGLAVPIANGRFWISQFQSSGFIVVYKTLYPAILNYSFTKNDDIDLKLSEMTSHKMLMFPFISIQKHFEFSNSDASLAIQHASSFDDTIKSLDKLTNIAKKYGVYPSLSYSPKT